MPTPKRQKAGAPLPDNPDPAVLFFLYANLYSPSSLEKLFGKSERASLWVPTSRQNGTQSALIAASRYQKHAIQTPPAIFQTVSRRGVPGNSQNQRA